ncbi:helix-turn-helix domain-containing protein [Nocardioides sp. R1-1]|uniref:helix-turn-helix domain-containing protein n=1 Tax=Nocardioides sp. R1-1 TaxID=3383502 RepID=UPI0038D2054C
MFDDVIAPEVRRVISVGAFQQQWRLFTAAAPGWAEGRHGRAAVHVVANMLSLAAQQRVDDYRELHRLSAELGAHRLAMLQQTLSVTIETDGELSLGSAFVHALAPPFYGPVLGEVDDEAESATLAALCTRTAMLFMLAGAHLVSPGPDIQTPQDFVDHFLHERLPQWRAQVLRYANDPWSPYAQHLLALAEAAGMPEFGTTIRNFVGTLRLHVDERDRQAVAAEILHLVSRSGLTQAEFARRVGTSPSRMSTYCSGRVTPSAALMVRMRRLANEPAAE